MFAVSYSGVHQAYAIALAAHEIGLLDRFYCSFYAAPGKFGGILNRFSKGGVNHRSLPGIPPDRVVENPWPELKLQLRTRFLGARSNSWISTAHEFDAWAARQLRRRPLSGIVCSENCALESFKAAKERGLTTIYDCPGANAELLQNTAEAAARITSIPTVSPADSSAVTRMKAQELGLADLVLTYSDFHTRGMLLRGVLPEKVVQIPLWTNPEFWVPPTLPRTRAKPLRVLYAGGLSLRKGVPFLVDAIRQLGRDVRLTLVGRLDPDIAPTLIGMESAIEILAPVRKERLRELYQSHDLFVFPTLGDSFGFVALEAMACGLPVVLTEHAGAPVPDPAWRVPVMNPGAIALRIRYYLSNPAILEHDGNVARAFAEKLTPVRYRQQISQLLASRCADSKPNK